MERLNIARLLFSLKKTGKQKQNRGSVFICGPCQRGCTYIFLALRTYFCHSSCAAQWWGRWGWRMNLQVSHGWGSAEGKCPGMSLDPKMCLNIGIKPPEQWLENCTIQPIYGHELCFFARFGMSTSLTPGNAFLSSKSLFWLDGLSFPFCLSVLPTNTLFSWDWGEEGFSKGWNTDFIIIFIITFLLYHLPASWEMLWCQWSKSFRSTWISKAVQEARVPLKDARNFSNQIFASLPNRKIVVSRPLSKNAECCSEVF